MSKGETMKVAVLTSEFYPVFSGGLGIAAYEIVKNSREVSGDPEFVVGMPDIGWKGSVNAKVIQVPHKLSIHTYSLRRDMSRPDLDWDNMRSINEFNFMLFQMMLGEGIDIAHANDWMTVPAGLLLKDAGKKFIFHVHSTEYDRTNNNPRPWVVELEKTGIRQADGVITTSNHMKRQLVSRYGADPNKVYVLYNGIDVGKFRRHLHIRTKKPGEKVVLFVGRLTVQKGIWELLHAARKVVDADPDVKFLIVGAGDQSGDLIRLSIDLGLQENVIFTGRVSEEELLAAYRISDIFIMPSVSEPFGIVALEAMASGKPVIVSKTSGVSEIIEHRITVDYWDTNLMASKILEAMNYPVLCESLVKNGSREVEKMDWKYSVKRLHKIYRRVMG